MSMFISLGAVLFQVLLQLSLIDAVCESTYQSDEYPIAIINLTYIDPHTLTLTIDAEDIGRYGLGKIEDLTGIVSHVSSNNHTSHNACDHLDVDRIPKEPYIALIKHGGCRDHVKLFHAAEANASAVVVYSQHLDPKLMKLGYKGVLVTGVPTNYFSEYLPIFIIDKDNPANLPLRVKTPQRNYTRADLDFLKEYIASNASKPIATDHFLPYIFISGEKGNEIAQLVDNGTRVVMSIICSTYPVRSHASVLFVSISFVFLMVLLMAWLVFYYIQRFRSILSKDLITKRLCTAAQKALERIPVKTINANELHPGADEECCAVCIEPLKVNELIRILPCQHSFHKVCVDPWLLERRSCPMCKLDIVLHFGLVHWGSQESIFEIEDTPVPNRRNSHLEMLHVATSRRNSASQTSPHLEERVTSACVFVQVNGDYMSCPLEKSWRLPFDPKATLLEDTENEDFAAGPSGLGTLTSDEKVKICIEPSLSCESLSDLNIEEVEIPLQQK